MFDKLMHNIHHRTELEILLIQDDKLNSMRFLMFVAYGAIETGSN